MATVVATIRTKPSVSAVTAQAKGAKVAITPRSKVSVATITAR